MLGLLAQSPTNSINQNIRILINLPGANLLKFPNNPTCYPFNSEDFQYPERIFANEKSVVEKYLHTPSEHELAIKFIRVHYDQTHNHHQSAQSPALKKLQTEIEIHQKVATSESIVSFYGFCICGDHILICMELMNMSLRYFYMWLHGTKIVSEEEALWHIAVSVIKALKVCKENSVMHRDIKPLNILVNSRGEIKLCDFGVSRILDDSKASTFVGTVAYWPPERFTNFDLRYDFRAEIWSLGVTILEFIMGKLPYAQNEDNIDMITAQKLIKEYKFARDKSLDSYSEDLKSLIESCLRPVSKRPTLEMLVNMKAYKRHEIYLLSEEYYEFVKHAIESQKLPIVNVVTQLNSTYASNEGASANDPYQDDDGFSSPFVEFRARTQSNLSVTGPSISRMSSSLDEFDRLEVYGTIPPSSSQPVSELLTTETDRMRLEDKKALNSDPSLLSTARENNTYLVRTLLEQCADPNIKDNYGNTALHLAAENKDDNKFIIELLLKYGANIDSQSKNGVTCLMKAAENNNIEIVRYLLQNGADINRKNELSENVLHYAARNINDNKFIIELLLKNGADIESQEENGYTCLTTAAYYNNIEIVRYLLQSGADINKQNRFGNTARKIAMSNGKDNKEIVELLLYYEEKSKPSFLTKIFRYIFGIK